MKDPRSHRPITKDEWQAIFWMVVGLIGCGVVIALAIIGCVSFIENP